MTNNWQKVRLNDVCIQITDGVHNTVIDTPNTQYYLLSCKNLKNGTIVIGENERTISEETLLTLRKRTQTAKGDVLLSSVGTIGETAIIKDENPNYEFQRSVAIFKPNPDCITSKFLFYTLNNNKKILQHAAHGAVQQCLFINPLKDFEIFLPPLDVQKRIAGVLSALDDKIELNNKINQNLDLQAQSLFNEYFPDIFSGNSCVGNYISPKRGKNLLSKDAVVGDVPVIAGGLQPATYHNVANTIAPVITISASGANAGFVNLWHIPVWSSDSSFIDNSITPFVYFWYVMLKLRQKEIFDAQTGSAQPHIYPQHIERMPLSELDMEKVKEYNEIISSLFEKIGYNTKENDRLSQLRDTLLPKLMSGEIKL